MKTSKAAGPSGVVADMLKVSGPNGAKLVADIANAMIVNGDMILTGKTVSSLIFTKGKVML